MGVQVPPPAPKTVKGMSGMDVKELVNERLKRKYEFVLPFQKISELEKEKLEEVRSTAHIKGFRPGKVPMSLIKKRFGEAVRSSVLDEHWKSVLDEFLKSKDEKPAAGVNVDLADREEENSDFVLTIDYECRPQIPDVDLSSIELERLVADLDDDFIDQAVQEDMRLHPDHETALEGHAIRSGDRVALSYRAAPVDDKDSQQDEERMLVIVGDNNIDEQTRFEAMKFNQVDPILHRAIFDIYRMSDHLIGMKIGDTAEFEADVPNIDALGPIAGKKAIFNIEIKAIQMRLDDDSEEEFARRFKYDSAAAYRLDLIAKLKRYYDDFTREILIDDLFRKLNEKLDFDVPEFAIDNEIDFQKRELGDVAPSDLENSADESGLSEGDSDASGADAAPDGEAAESEIENKIRTLAKRRVRYFLFLEELARKHQISLKPDDFMNFVNDWSGSESERSSILDGVENDAEYRQRVLNMAITDKTTNFVLELVNVKTTTIPPGDLIDLHDGTEDTDLSVGLRYDLNSD